MKSLKTWKGARRVLFGGAATGAIVCACLLLTGCPLFRGGGDPIAKILTFDWGAFNPDAPHADAAAQSMADAIKGLLAQVNAAQGEYEAVELLETEVPMPMAADETMQFKVAHYEEIVDGVILKRYHNGAVPVIRRAVQETKEIWTDATETVLRYWELEKTAKMVNPDSDVNRNTIYSRPNNSDRIISKNPDAAAVDAEIEALLFVSDEAYLNRTGDEIIDEGEVPPAPDLGRSCYTCAYDLVINYVLEDYWGDPDCANCGVVIDSYTYVDSYGDIVDVIRAWHKRSY